MASSKDLETPNGSVASDGCWRCCDLDLDRAGKSSAVKRSYQTDLCSEESGDGLSGFGFDSRRLLESSLSKYMKGLASHHALWMQLLWVQMAQHWKHHHALWMHHPWAQMVQNSDHKRLKRPYGTMQLAKPSAVERQKASVPRHLLANPLLTHGIRLHV